MRLVKILITLILTISSVYVMASPSSNSDLIINRPPFSQPEDLNFGYLDNDGRKIRYAIANEVGKNGTILIIPGNSEFCEKYYELINDLEYKKKDWRVIVYDPFSQGLSGRYLEERHIIHSKGFENDIDDIKYIVSELIESKGPDHSFKIIAHSKGGHFAYRYLQEDPSPNLQFAVLESPMLRFNTGVPNWLAKIIVETGSAIGMDKWRMGTTKWPNNWSSSAFEKLSSDPIRSRIRYYWEQNNLDLMSDAVSVGFVKHALRSVSYIENKEQIAKIKTPIYMALGASDKIVPVKNSIKACNNIESCEYEIYGSKYDNTGQHVLLSETDEIREPLINKIKDLIYK